MTLQFDTNVTQCFAYGQVTMAIIKKAIIKKVLSLLMSILLVEGLSHEIFGNPCLKHVFLSQK